MTNKEFFYLVANMREAQAKYFKNREQSTLRAARRLETEVDQEIRRVKEILRKKEDEYECTLYDHKWMCPPTMDAVDCEHCGYSRKREVEIW